MRTGRNSNRPCKAVASYYDERRQRNLCGIHAAGAPRGTGVSWYEKEQRADGLNAAAPGDRCESGAHPGYVVPAKAVKHGRALCMLCSSDAELDELRAFNAAQVDDRQAA